MSTTPWNLWVALYATLNDSDPQYEDSLLASVIEAQDRSEALAIAAKLHGHTWQLVALTNNPMGLGGERFEARYPDLRWLNVVNEVPRDPEFVVGGTASLKTAILT